MRVLVTGASGFLGRHLCRALAARGDEVVALVRDAVGLPLPEVHAVVRGDLSLPVLERALAEYEVEVAFHLAAQAQVSVAKHDPTGTFEANVGGTQRLLEACRRQGTLRVVTASSDKAYGSGPVPYREDQMLLPDGIYATSKACADHLARSYALEYGMRICVVRCGNLYGPGQMNFSTLISGAIRSAIRGEPFRMRSDGKSRRDYLHVSDAVRGYLAAGDSMYVGPVNFGAEAPRSVLEVVCAISEAVGTPLQVDRSEFFSSVEIADQWLDCSRAREWFGWRPEVDFAEGIERTVAWYRKVLS